MPSTIFVRDLNPHLLCQLCFGYLIDACTIDECLHSFCKKCIVKYLDEEIYCPVCGVLIHDTKPLLHLKNDLVLQTLVYKLVPRLLENELEQRQIFLNNNTETKLSSLSIFMPSQNYHLVKPEIYSKQHSTLQIQLSHATIIPQASSIFPQYSENLENVEYLNDHNIFLECSGLLEIKLLKKFLFNKYFLDSSFEVEFFYENNFLKKDKALWQIVHKFELAIEKPVVIQYVIFEYIPNPNFKSKQNLANQFKCKELQKSSTNLSNNFFNQKLETENIISPKNEYVDDYDVNIFKILSNSKLETSNENISLNCIPQAPSLNKINLSPRKMKKLSIKNSVIVKEDEYLNEKIANNITKFNNLFSILPFSHVDISNIFNSSSILNSTPKNCLYAEETGEILNHENENEYPFIVNKSNDFSISDNNIFSKCIDISSINEEKYVRLSRTLCERNSGDANVDSTSPKMSLCSEVISHKLLKRTSKKIKSYINYKNHEHNNSNNVMKTFNFNYSKARNILVGVNKNSVSSNDSHNIGHCKKVSKKSRLYREMNNLNSNLSNKLLKFKKRRRR